MQLLRTRLLLHWASGDRHAAAAPFSLQIKLLKLCKLLTQAWNWVWMSLSKFSWSWSWCWEGGTRGFPGFDNICSKSEEISNMYNVHSCATKLKKQKSYSKTHPVPCARQRWQRQAQPPPSERNDGFDHCGCGITTWSSGARLRETPMAPILPTME